LRPNIIIGVIAGILVFVALQFLLPPVVCRDGWRSSSIGRKGACSYHGGVISGGIWPLLALGTSVAAGIYTSKIIARHYKPRLFHTDVGQQDQAFASEIKQIIFAIDNGKKITFFYNGSKQSSYQKRIIKPIELNRVAHQYGRNYTLCIKGHCEMRNAIRNFALKRMKGLEVI
jgi:hypothetical protein